MKILKKVLLSFAVCGMALSAIAIQDVKAAEPIVLKQALNSKKSASVTIKARTEKAIKVVLDKTTYVVIELDNSFIKASFVDASGNKTSPYSVSENGHYYFYGKFTAGTNYVVLKNDYSTDKTTNYALYSYIPPKVSFNYTKCEGISIKSSKTIYYRSPSRYASYIYGSTTPSVNLSFTSGNTKLLTLKKTSNTWADIYTKKYGITTITVTTAGYTDTYGRYYAPNSRKITFTVKPRTPSGSVSNKYRKALYFKWTKDSLCTGYKIQIATNKKFTKGVKTKYVGGSKKTYTLKGLKKGRKYYFRMATYKKVGSKKLWSKWSTGYSYIKVR